MWMILPAKLRSSYGRKGSGAFFASVPMTCEAPSAGMQSLVLLGAGHGATAVVPRITVSGVSGLATVLSCRTWIRVRRETFGR